MPSLLPMTDTIAATEELKKALAAEEGARRWVRRLAMALGVVLAVGGGLAWSAQHRPPPAARFTTATVAVGDVLEKVQATGTVQPLLQVNVGAQVNGRVTQVLVDYQLGRQEGRRPRRDRSAHLRHAGERSAGQPPGAAARSSSRRRRRRRARRRSATSRASRPSAPQKLFAAEPREPRRSRHGEGQLRSARAPSTKPRWPTSRARTRPSAPRPRSSASRRRTSGTRRSTRRSTAWSSRAGSTRAPPS